MSNHAIQSVEPYMADANPGMCLTAFIKDVLLSECNPLGRQHRTHSLVDCTLKHLMRA